MKRVTYKMKISVVVSTYNGEKYIEEQINSIIGQSLRPDEIIICDDCSTDKTVEICKNIKDRLDVNLIIKVNKKNLGVCKNFINAMDYVSGDVVFLCDQDDVWLDKKIEKFMNVFDKERNCKVVLSDAWIVDDDLNKSVRKNEDSLWQSIRLNISENIYESDELIRCLLKRNIFTGMCMAVKKELLMGLETSEFMLHDEIIGWKAVLEGGVFLLNEKLVLYRQHSYNVVGVNKRSKFKNIKCTRLQIKKSTYNSFNKYKEILKMAENTMFYIQIKGAEDFYKWRISCYENKRKLKSLKEIFEKVKDKKYSMFTSDTERAIYKDIFYVITNGRK